MSLRDTVVKYKSCVIYNRYGKKHRVGKPACVCDDEYLEYREYGLLHRVGLPAVIDSCGPVSYFKRGRPTHVGIT